MLHTFSLFDLCENSSLGMIGPNESDHQNEDDHQHQQHLDTVTSFVLQSAPLTKLECWVWHSGIVVQ